MSLIPRQGTFPHPVVYSTLRIQQNFFFAILQRIARQFRGLGRIILNLCEGLTAHFTQ